MPVDGVVVSYDEFLAAMNASAAGPTGLVAAALLRASTTLPRFRRSTVTLLIVYLVIFATLLLLTIVALFVLLRKSPLWIARKKDGLWVANTRLFIGASYIIVGILNIAECFDRILTYSGAASDRHAIVMDGLRFIPLYAPFFVYAHGVMALIILCRPTPAPHDPKGIRARNLTVYLLNATLFGVPLAIVGVQLPLSAFIDLLWTRAADNGKRIANVLESEPTASIEPWLGQIRDVYHDQMVAQRLWRTWGGAWASWIGILLLAFFPSFIVHFALLIKLRHSLGTPPAPQAESGTTSEPEAMDFTLVFSWRRVRRALRNAHRPVVASPQYGASGHLHPRPEPYTLMVLVIAGYGGAIILGCYCVFVATRSLHDPWHWQLNQWIATTVTLLLSIIALQILMFRPAWKILRHGREEGRRPQRQDGVPASWRPTRLRGKSVGGGGITTLDSIPLDGVSSRRWPDEPIAIRLDSPPLKFV